jgi:gamma-glutamylputrescine oxidase
LVHSYSRDMDVIESSHGRATAQALGGMAFEGAKIIKERIQTYNIDAHFKPGGIFAALNAKQLRHNQAHKRLWERYGNTELELLDAAGMARATGSQRYVGGLLDHSGGHVHPLRLAQGEAQAFESLGGVIHEQSAVTRIERGTTAVVHTATGQVKAKFVIVACNAYLGDLEPKLAQRAMPCGTQVVATEPLGERFPEILPTDACVEDCSYLLDYFRLSADRRLIYGGGVIYGARDPAHVESIIRPKLLKTYPHLLLTRLLRPRRDLHPPDRAGAQRSHPGPGHPLRCLRPPAPPPISGGAAVPRAVHGAGGRVLPAAGQLRRVTRAECKGRSGGSFKAPTPAPASTPRPPCCPCGHACPRGWRRRHP